MTQSELKDIERVARVMCEAEGFAPGGYVVLRRAADLAVGARGHFLAPQVVPAWMLYTQAATAAIDEVRRMEAEKSQQNVPVQDEGEVDERRTCDEPLEPARQTHEAWRTARGL